MKIFPNNIKNIIFDLGGVLIDIDANRTINAFNELGLPDLIQAGGWGYNHDVFLNMEKGLITVNEFRDGIRSLLPKSVSDQKVDEAWCAMMIDFPTKRIELLHQLQSKYKLYLFSNTNAIHVNHFHEMFEKKFGYPMSNLFVKEYFSNDMNLRKPCLDSFQYVLNDANLIPGDTLFIDDLNENAEGAKTAGMHSLWLTPEMDLISVFNA